MRALLRMLAPVTAALLLTGVVGAQESVSDEPVPVQNTTEVPGHPGVYYFDLLKQVVPDLVANEGIAKGHEHVPLRHILGAEANVDMPEEIVIGSFEAREFESEGQKRSAVLAGLGESEDVAQPTMLAVFDDSPVPKLIDAVDVGMDRFTDFVPQMPLRIGPKDEALVTLSTHSNSSETFDILAMIFLREGKLTLIDDLYAFGSAGCGFKRVQYFAFADKAMGRSGPYDGVEVTLTEELLHEDTCSDQAPPEAYKKSATTVYVWDEKLAKFVPNSTAVQEMQDATERG